MDHFGHRRSFSQANAASAHLSARIFTPRINRMSSRHKCDLLFLASTAGEWLDFQMNSFVTFQVVITVLYSLYQHCGVAQEQSTHKALSALVTFVRPILSSIDGIRAETRIFRPFQGKTGAFSWGETSTMQQVRTLLLELIRSRSRRVVLRDSGRCRVCHVW